VEETAAEEKEEDVVETVEEDSVAIVVEVAVEVAVAEMEVAEAQETKKNGFQKQNSEDWSRENASNHLNKFIPTRFLSKKLRLLMSS
jgi:hypothetical protein